MHDVVLIQYLERFQQLLEYLQSLLLMQPVLLLQPMLQCPLVAEFVHKIKVIRGFEHLDVSDDIGTLLDSLQDLDFVDCALLELGVLLELYDGDDLHCKLLVCLKVAGLVNSAVHALAYDLVQGVVLDYLSLHKK